MTISLAIYSLEKPHLMLYNYRIERIYLDSVEKVLNSPAWETIQSSELVIQENNNTYFYFKKTDIYIYVICSSKMLNSLIFRSIEQIDLYLSKQPNKDLSLHNNYFSDTVTNIQSLDKITIVQKQVDDVQDTMKQAITSALVRQVKIDDLDGKVVELLSNSEKFENGSKRLRNRMKWSNIKLWMMVGFVVVAVVGLALLAIFV
jgi:hypothetical protein